MRRITMTNTTKPTTPDVDPATAEHLKILERQRARAHRVLLKRRRRKSNQ